MSDKFYRRLDYIIGLLPIGALFGLLVIVANVEVKDLDLWLHIGMGKFITQHGTIPGVDILSCTIPGKPWINHEWLFQIIVYNLFDRFGADGPIKMQIAVVTLTMLTLLFLGYQKNKQLLIAVLLCMVLLVFQQRFTMRPDLFSLLFFTFYIYVLALHIDKKWAVAALVLVQILWTNMHGFFFFGPLFVLIGLVSEFIKRHVKLPYEWNASGRLTDPEYRRLKMICAAVILASLVNPHTFQGAWYPISVFFSFSGENKIFFKHIQELQKPITSETLFHGGRFLYYKILIVISLCTFYFNRRRIDISALFFWIIFLIFSLMAARNTPFFAFAAYLVIITNMISVSLYDIVPLRFTAKKFEHLTNIMIKCMLLLWILNYAQGVSGRAYYDFDKFEQKSLFGGISLKNYPTKAVDFLIDNKVKGNFFNDFNSGAYLIGRCFPDIKVFIDGRTEVYGGHFFREYQEIWEKGDMKRFQAAVDRYHLSGAFLNSNNQRIPDKFLKGLYDDEEWKIVYFDYDAVILLRDIPENKDLIDKFAIDLNTWKPKKMDLLKVGSNRVLPYRHYYRAMTLHTLGLNDAAMAEAKEAIKTAPGYAEARKIIGKIHAGRKEFEEAFEHFRIAALSAPRDKNIRHNLALSYTDLKAYKGAIKQYQIITELWPKDPKGHFLLSRAYTQDKQYSEALETLNHAHELNTEDVLDILKIGDIMQEQEAYEQAQTAYEMALKTNKKVDEIKEKIANLKLLKKD